jgi:hypothetical protein
LQAPGAAITPSLGADLPKKIRGQTTNQKGCRNNTRDFHHVHMHMPLIELHATKAPVSVARLLQGMMECCNLETVCRYSAPLSICVFNVMAG